MIEPIHGLYLNKKGVVVKVVLVLIEPIHGLYLNKGGGEGGVPSLSIEPIHGLYLNVVKEHSLYDRKELNRYMGCI